MTRWLGCIALLAALTACKSTQYINVNKPLPMDAPASVGTVGSVAPSVTSPRRGWHLSAGVAAQSGGSEELYDISHSSPGLLANLGVTFQSDLSANTTLGWFAGLNANAEVSFTRLEWDKTDYETTDQAFLDSAGEGRLDLLGQADLRVGLTAKLEPIMVSAYGLGGYFGETGDYSDFRRRVDGTRNLYNFSSQPVVPYGGFGGDLNFIFFEGMMIGASCELQVYWSQTQSYLSSSWVETTDVVGPDEEVVTTTYTIQTSAQGRRKLTWQRTWQLYIEIDSVRGFIFSKGDDFGAGLLYRW